MHYNTLVLISHAQSIYFTIKLPLISQRLNTDIINEYEILEKNDKIMYKKNNLYNATC